MHKHMHTPINSHNPHAQKYTYSHMQGMHSSAYWTKDMLSPTPVSYTHTYTQREQSPLNHVLKYIVPVFQ